MKGEDGMRANCGPRVAGLVLVLLLGLSLVTFANGEDNSTAFIYQTGSNNVVDIEQIGKGNYSYVSQDGDKNTATVNMSGGRKRDTPNTSRR